VCVNGADETKAIAGAAACLPGDRWCACLFKSRAALSCEFERQAPGEKDRVLRRMIFKI
jgi:hypothetical protein